MADWREPWCNLVDLLQSHEFDVILAFFEDASNRQLGSGGISARTVNDIPDDVSHIRIERSMWVRGDDTITENIEEIDDKLADYPQYTTRIEDGDLIVSLT